jgi:hypothetical protein
VNQQLASTATTGNTGGGLMQVQVTVSWAGTQISEPVHVTLSRLVIDPQSKVPAPSPSTSTTGS